MWKMDNLMQSPIGRSIPTWASALEPFRPRLEEAPGDGADPTLPQWAHKVGHVDPRNETTFMTWNTPILQVMKSWQFLTICDCLGAPEMNISFPCIPHPSVAFSGWKVLRLHRSQIKQNVTIVTKPTGSNWMRLNMIKQVQMKHVHAKLQIPTSIIKL